MISNFVRIIAFFVPLLGLYRVFLFYPYDPLAAPNLLRRVVVRYPHHTTLQTSQDFSRILKYGKESKMFVIKIDVQKRSFLHSKSHVVINKQKIYEISWVLYF